MTLALVLSGLEQPESVSRVEVISSVSAGLCAVMPDREAPAPKGRRRIPTPAQDTITDSLPQMIHRTCNDYWSMAYPPRQSYLAFAYHSAFAFRGRWRAGAPI